MVKYIIPIFACALVMSISQPGYSIETWVTGDAADVTVPTQQGTMACAHDEGLE